MMLIRSLPVLFLLMFSLTSCQGVRSSQRAVEVPQRALAEAMQVKADATPLEKVNAGAIEQTTQTTGYDASYVKLDYPNGTCRSIPAFAPTSSCAHFARPGSICRKSCTRT